MTEKIDLKSKIRSIPHFPKHGVLFRDITTLLNDSRCFRYAVNGMIEHFRDERIDKVVSAESRGFIFGSVIAHELNAGFVPLRKPGKLPHETVREEYDTEYSKDALEMHRDAIKKGENVLVVDDLLATGGTTEAAVRLVEKLGGNVVGIAILIELGFLKGRERLKDYEIFTLVDYETEE